VALLPLASYSACRQHHSATDAYSRHQY